MSNNGQVLNAEIAQGIWDAIEGLSSRTKMALIEDDNCPQQIIECLSFDDDYEVRRAALIRDNVSQEVLDYVIAGTISNLKTCKVSEQYFEYECLIEIVQRRNVLSLASCKRLLELGHDTICENLADHILPNMDSFLVQDLWTTLAEKKDDEWVREAVARKVPFPDVILKLMFDKSSFVRDAARQNALERGISVSVASGSMS